MAEASRDENFKSTLLGVSSADGSTPVPLQVNPVTHRVLAEITGGSTPLTTKGDLLSHNGTNDVRIPVGTNGQVPSADSSEASGIKWITVSGTGDMTKAVYDTDDNGSVDSSQTVVGFARKGSSGTITKGSPVYLSGYNPSGFIEVEDADATDNTTMPALGIAAEDMTNAALSKIICLGRLTGIDTSAFSVGDVLYVSTTAGELVNTRPTGTSNYVQPVGSVLRSHATLGAIKVSCSAEVEGLPNLQENYFWKGDASNEPTAEEFEPAVLSTAITDTDNNFNATDIDGALTELVVKTSKNGYDRYDTDSMPDVTFTSGTRTISVAVKSGQSSFHFWVNNKKITKTTTQTVVLPNASGTYYTYFDDSGVLQYVLDSGMTSIDFYKYAITSMTYFNASDSSYLHNPDELHGIDMSGITHERLHSCDGAKLFFGCEIEGLSDGSPSYTQSTLGVMYDEDISHLILANNTSHSMLYRFGTDGAWRQTTPDLEIGHKEGGDTYYSWNRWTGTTWEWAEGGSSTDYWITFFILTPSGVMKMAGQNAYSNRNDARNAIETEVNNIKTDGLPSTEFLFLGAVICRRNGDLENMSDGSVFYNLVDRRSSGTGTGSGTTIYAGDVPTITTSFDGVLSTADTDVQKALDTIDDMPLDDLSGTATADFSMNTHKITALVDPTTDQEAATKKYVDDNAGGAPEGTAVKSTGETGGVKFLREDGDGTSSWQVPSGSGDVSKVGTPVDNQVGVWTGDGTIEGTTGLTYDGSKLGVTGDINVSNNIELGSSSDTTIGRVSAGVIAVEGVVIPSISSTSTLTNKTIDLTDNTVSGTTTEFNAALSDGSFTTLAGTETLTNKRITPRVSTEASSATPTINTDNVDAHSITALATAVTSMTTNLSGTPTNFQKLIIRFLDNGTGRAITWGASFASKGATLPTTTTASKLLTVGLIYNTVTSDWESVAVAEEA